MLETKNCMICTCENSMALDKDKLSKALGFDVETLHHNLCRTQLAQFEGALQEGQPLLVGCTQEAPLFQEISEEQGLDNKITFVNIREQAAWSEQGEKTSPKIAALLKASEYQAQPARLKTINSDGMCLVYGAGQQALEAAQLLSQYLSVTLLLCNDEPLVLPRIFDIPIYHGVIESAQGSFGAFSLTVNSYAPSLPSSRQQLDFAMFRDGATSQCSLILDLSNQTPLFTGHNHRDGYKRVDHGDPAAVLRAVIELSDMVGEFEKPIYVDYTAETCAHARSQKQGCSKCLDVCPAGAITSVGDHIAIDSGICGGCGSCHSVCPTGSIAYQYSSRNDVIGYGQLLLKAYHEAGGKNATLLVHNEPFGADLIAAMARYGRGLPAHVIPFAQHSTTMMGHVEMAALLASGAQRIIFLCDPALQDEVQGLEAELALVDALLQGFDLEGSEQEKQETAAQGKGRCMTVISRDPDHIQDVIWHLPSVLELSPMPFQPFGSKRDIARLAFGKLNDLSPLDTDLIALPKNAPYGRVMIDQSACTLCMACTSACPASAMIDTPGEPTLRFVENACVQCGLCVATCPEKALQLVPQLNLAPSAMQPITLYEEAPFCCIVCDTPFATQSTIERISNQLAGKHTMFASGEKAKLIQMCENCRIETQANSSDDPFSSNQRPRVRTTEDYIEAERQDLSVDDFLMDD